MIVAWASPLPCHTGSHGETADMPRITPAPRRPADASCTSAITFAPTASSGSTTGRRGAPDVEAELPHHVADRARAAVQEARVGHPAKPAVDRRRVGAAASRIRFSIALLLARHDVRGHADRAPAAHAPEVEVVVVVAAPDLEVAAPPPSRAALCARSPFASLLPTMFGHLGAAQHASRPSVHAHAAGHVVDDHREGVLSAIARKCWKMPSCGGFR